MSLNLGFSDVSLVIGLELWAWGRNAPEVKCPLITSEQEVYIIKMAVTVDLGHLANIMCARLLYLSYLVFPPSHTLFFGLESLSTAHAQKRRGN